MQLADLKPKELWDEFFEICKIPHGSGNIDALRAFIRARAEQRGFKCVEDGEAGNLLIVKPADPGFENAPVICCQGHLDMVCSKRSDCAHDFIKDPIKPQISKVDGEDVVIATGTSLGADNGIGVATGLALIFDKSFKTGKIEVFCTKDEETTMHGVQHLKSDLLSAKYLLNLDSEDLGVITIGSSGGFCQTITIPQYPIQECKSCDCVTLTVKSCSGGHSGIDASEYHANASKCLGRLLDLAVSHGAGLCKIVGGVAHNAIPMDATACVCFSGVSKGDFLTKAKVLGELIKGEFTATDAGMIVEVNDSCACCENCKCISNENARKIVDFLNIVPSTVLRMSQDVKGLTESSINLGKVRFNSVDQSQNFFLLLARSSINSFLPYIQQQLNALARLAGFTTSDMQDPYGGWAPNTKSALLKIAISETAKVMKMKDSEVKIEAIHAGLECGEIISKYPHIEAISIGPTIKNPHSDRELIKINTVEQFYQITKNIIQELSK
ncbi:Aminoacyl-histidine dipeptidase [Spironucleus salmonicida]|uniref:Aminoacyl-histidine dipeptidase n=1 Tax=Spironucleus salmonicida TaxID=348837 RepID=V6LIP5_9EUKA|nr:Aminoacyl-histidine dipeptidase [Spironucleus salmonicida]|eukprot:EST44470.1 Aminoacyl-histidine dipeptidase [Spironucleus salmonicida]